MLGLPAKVTLPHKNCNINDLAVMDSPIIVMIVYMNLILYLPLLYPYDM